MAGVSAWLKRLILLFSAVLAACILTACGAFAEDLPDLSDPQLVVFSLGADGAFDAEKDDYLLFEDDVIVLRESDGFTLSPLDQARTAGGMEFPCWQGSGRTLPSWLAAGKTVCFVPSGANALQKMELLTVTEVSGNTFVGYAGPPDALNDGGSASKWILRWVYKAVKKADIDSAGNVNDIKKHFDYNGMIAMDAVFDVGVDVKIKKESSKHQLLMSFGFDFSIPSLKGMLDSKGHSVRISLDLVEIPLVGIPELGLNLTVGPEITMNGKGEFQAHMTNSRKTVKFTIYSDGDTKTEKASEDGSFELDLASGELDCTIGLSTGMAIKAVILSAGFSGNMGYHFLVGVCGNEGGNPRENEAAGSVVRTWHMCEPGKCMTGNAAFETGWGFAVTAGVGPFSIRLMGFDIPVIEKGLWRFYYSITYGEFGLAPYTRANAQDSDPSWTGTICPHQAWRLNVKAVHKNDPGRTVPYATIGLAKAPDYRGRKPTETAVKANSYFQTGSDGKGVLFIPAGSQTVLRATDHETSASGELAMIKYGAEESAVIEIDYEPLDVHFFPNTDQKVESMPNSISAYPGDTVSLKGPSGFPRTEGMEFAGWSEDPNARWNEPEKLRTEEQLTLDRSYTFYAVWKRIYTIRFYNYDHTLLRTLQVPEFSSVAYTGARPARPADEHYDYIFSGWEPALETTATKDADYIAQYWGKCKTFYTVTWVDEDGNLLETDEGVIYLSMPQYNGPTPQKHGTSSQYYFSGWDPELSPVTGNITYTARFSTVPTEMCVITFEGDGGYLVPAPQLVLRGNRAAEPADEPRRDGYEFAGWMLEGSPYDFSQPVLNSMTLKAAWDQVSYQFTEGSGQTWLNTAENGPSFTVSRNLRDDKTFGMFKELYLDGNFLDGTHFSHEKGSLRITLLPDWAKTLASGEHRIRALFADGETECGFTVKAGAYTITYNLAGGELPAGEENPSSYTSEDAFTLINPIMEDHIFTGWTGTGLRGRSIRVSVPKGSAGNRSYTAHWTIRGKCLVLFFDTGEETASGIPGPVIFDPERSSRVILPSAIPEKEGWHFLGWNTRENGSGTGYAPGAVLELRESLALYAQWARLIPKTRDSGNPVLWIGLILIGVIGAAVIIQNRRK